MQIPKRLRQLVFGLKLTRPARTNAYECRGSAEIWGAVGRCIERLPWSDFLFEVV